MPESPSVARDLQLLEAELKRLEAEYNMFFAGRLPKPPWETRGRVEALIKQYDRAYIQNTGDRFRFSTLQSRFAALVDLWDRGLRSREEGRAGPYSGKRRETTTESARPKDRVVYSTTMKDPLRESDRLEDLYDSLVEARRENGEAGVPFHKFAELVRTQVEKLSRSGGEVGFKVTVKDGKVSFTARALKGKDERK